MTTRINITCVFIMAIVTLIGAYDSSLSAPAGSRIVTGLVVDESDETPLAGVMMLVDGGLVFGPTDVDGRFVIQDVPATNFRLNAERMGCASAEVEICPADNEIVIKLAVLPIDLGDEEVTGANRGERQAFETAVSLERISPREIQKTIGAGGDVLRSLQTLPSVAVANDFSSQLYIRGGGPEQNAVLVDGVPVYTPYRALSVLSGFNTLLIEKADLYAGGFGVQHGDRLSGVLDIAYRRGRATGRRKEVSANTLMTHMVTEGAMGGSATTYIFSARRTHYDLLMNHQSASDRVVYPTFYDLYAKLSGNVRGRTFWDFFGWYGSEEMNLSQGKEAQDDRSFNAELGQRYRNGTVGMKLRVISSPKVLHNLTAAYSSDDRTMNLGGDFDAVYDECRTMALVQGTSSYNLAEPLILTLGGGLQTGRALTDYRAEGLHDIGNEERRPDGFDYRPAQSSFNYDFRATRTFAFTELDLSPSSRWQCTVGGRLDHNSAFTGIDFSPRATVNYHLSPAWSLRGSYGWYFQSPAPEAFIEKNYYPDLSAHPELQSEKAVHHLVGLTRELGDGLVRIEGYFKDLSDVIVDRNDGSFTPINAGNGEAWGVELYAQLSDLADRRLSGNVSYTLAHTYMQTPDDSYNLRYDQRHTLAANSQYRLGSGWRIAAKFRWGSGYPYTDVVDRAPGIFNPAETPWVPVWGATNGARLPAYSRFDVRATKSFGWGHTGWEAYIEVLNVFNRKNVFQYEWDREYLAKHARYQLPLLPNIGVTVKF